MIEWAWSLLSLIGAVAATWGFFDAWRDLRALVNLRNGRRIYAFGYMRAEALTGTIQGLLLLIGIAAILDPADTTLNPFVAALILVNLLLVSKSLLEARDRIRMRRALHAN